MWLPFITIWNAIQIRLKTCDFCRIMCPFPFIGFVFSRVIVDLFDFIIRFCFSLFFCSILKILISSYHSFEANSAKKKNNKSTFWWCANYMNFFVRSFLSFLYNSQANIRLIYLLQFTCWIWTNCVFDLEFDKHPPSHNPTNTKLYKWWNIRNTNSTISIS